MIVPVWLSNHGNMLTGWVTSTGTWTILPCNLSCLPLGACVSLWNALFGVSSLHSNSFRSKNLGLSGNTIIIFYSTWWDFVFNYMTVTCSINPFFVINTFPIIDTFDHVRNWLPHLISKIVTLCLFHCWSQHIQT